MKPISPALLVAVLALASCGGSTEPDFGASVTCGTPTVVQLAVGEYEVIDVSANAGCIRLPATGAAGAEYIIAAVSGATTQVSGAFTYVGQAGTGPAPRAAAAMATSGAGERVTTALAFHDMLRRREARLATSPGLRAAPPSGQRVSPPVVGDVRSFKVCETSSCTSFVDVAATAKFVGPRGAIFLDNSVPAGGYTQADIDQIGVMFDGPAPNMYGIDTTAFGRESDLDGNGVVIILLSDQVNQLSGNCSDGTIVLGYFFGLDFTTDPNSNQGEVFYGLVPDPGNQACTASRSFALLRLPPVFIHEFQHMISFNQHTMVRSGLPEQLWLNEGLSHFAEELGGRLLPDSRCPQAASCLSQFVGSGNLQNAFNYLGDIEDHFLVATTGTGSLAERGASWLFVRWLADQFATDTILGTSLTRALVQTSATGAANVAAVTGEPFDQLVGQWQLANQMEGNQSFTEPTGRLRYRSWNFAELFPSYPVNPDRVLGDSFGRTGTLRAGSGRHTYIDRPANAGPFDIQLRGAQNFDNLQPRLAVLRFH